jgi:hypothetical protein
MQRKGHQPRGATRESAGRKRSDFWCARADVLAGAFEDLLCAGVNLLATRQKDEYVARRLLSAPSEPEGDIGMHEQSHVEVDVHDGLYCARDVVVGRFGEIGRLDGVHPAFEADDGGVVLRGDSGGRSQVDSSAAHLAPVVRVDIRIEEVDKGLRINGRRGDDEAQIRSLLADSAYGHTSGSANPGSARNALLENAKEEVGVATPLMRFVDHEDAVLGQERVEHRLAEEHSFAMVDATEAEGGAVRTIGHVLYPGPRWRAEVLEADRVTDLCRDKLSLVV